MTEQELQRMKSKAEMDDFWGYETDEVLRLLNEVERLQKEKTLAVGMINEDQAEINRLQKQVEFNRKYGIHSNAMKEIERLRKALEEIRETYKAEGYGPFIDEIAKRALEGKE